MRVPRDIEVAIVSRLFRDADELDWGHISSGERTAQYSNWLQARDIGGELTRYMTSDEARVWIKDGPMKEWSRAVNGVGRYADLIVNPQASAASIVTKALGQNWVVQDGSLMVKPLRVVVARDQEQAVFTWGPARDFKHLLWAALKADAEGDPRDWVLCTTSTFTRPLPANSVRFHQRIARRCALKLIHVTV